MLKYALCSLKTTIISAVKKGGTTVFKINTKGSRCHIYCVTRKQRSCQQKTKNVTVLWYNSIISCSTEWSCWQVFFIWKWRNWNMVQHHSFKKYRMVMVMHAMGYYESGEISTKNKKMEQEHYLTQQRMVKLKNALCYLKETHIAPKEWTVEQQYYFK